MSKEIKDLINSIKTNQVGNKIISPPQEITEPISVPLEVVNVKKENPVSDKTEAKKKKPEKKGEKESSQSQIVQVNEPKNTKKSNALSEDFFTSLAEMEFSFEQKSVSNIDDRVYEIFMLLKRKKRVKNIAVIINTILNNYIEENKEQIKKILLDNQL
jgi:hypothetical protein